MTNSLPLAKVLTVPSLIYVYDNTQGVAKKSSHSDANTKTLALSELHILCSKS